MDSELVIEKVVRSLGEKIIARNESVRKIFSPIMCDADFYGDNFVDYVEYL